MYRSFKYLQNYNSSKNIETAFTNTDLAGCMLQLSVDITLHTCFKFTNYNHVFMKMNWSLTALDVSYKDVSNPYTILSISHFIPLNTILI